MGVPVNREDPLGGARGVWNGCLLTLLAIAAVGLVRALAGALSSVHW